MPGIAKLHFGSFGRMQFATRAERAKGQKRMSREKRIPGLGRIEESAAQEDEAGLAAELIRDRLGSVCA
jgi:hypothetical protein